jgi:hypothetical protein
MQPKPVANLPLKIPLTDERRELMMRVMDGRWDLANTMYMFHNYKHCDTFLKWLVVHKFTGNRFVELLVKQFGSSVPKLVDFIVMHSQKARAESSKA